MKRKPVLKDHKRIGKKLIPPLLQLPNMVETSFEQDMLPNLIWMSAIFRKAEPREAVNLVIDFVKVSAEALGREDFPPLAFLESVRLLDDEGKRRIRAALLGTSIPRQLIQYIGHQNALFSGYPMAFLLEPAAGTDRSAGMIDELKSDVGLMLDRYGPHATKVQVTTLVAMLASQKMMISSEIDLPDFDSIFNRPESAESDRAASFARAMMNGGLGALAAEESPDIDRSGDEWTRNFWTQAFALSGCD